jgi:broad specificity phosphatase PhoE
LILVKHALPEIAPEVPRREWRLSAKGIATCGRLAEYLARYRPARVITSPEPKAHETALAIASAVDAFEVQTIGGLREHDDGDTPYEDETGFRAKVATFFAYPSTPVFGPETADDAHQRFSMAIAGTETGEAGESVVAVAHGRVISLFVARRNDLDPYDLWLRLGLPSVVVLRMPDYRIEELVEHF